MTEQTIHIKTPISRGDMESVIEGLEMACPGSRIEITETFDLIVIDERQAAALKALFSGKDAGLAKAAMASKPRTAQKAAQKKTDQKKEPGAHSYVIEGTGEVISAQRLHKRLAVKDIPEFTVVTKGKGERFRKKIELVLLVLILKSAAEAVLGLAKHGVEEIGMPAEAAGFLHDLLSTHPQPEVSNFYCHKLDALE